MQLIILQNFMFGDGASRYNSCKCSTQTCTPDGHLHRVTYTRCSINTINSSDDEHVSARNM